MIDRHEAYRQVEGLELAILKKEGRDLYQAFSHIKKYRNKQLPILPTHEDYEALARNLDLTVPYIKKRVEAFLLN